MASKCLILGFSKIRLRLKNTLYVKVFGLYFRIEKLLHKLLLAMKELSNFV